MLRVTIFLTSLALLATSAPAQKPTDEAQLGPGLSLTVYNQDLAVIKERRLRELPRGRDVLKFADVAARIIPQTVQFGSLSHPADTRVVEQNYEFDLVSAEKLLDKYIDKPIRIITRDGQFIQGVLLSFDAAQLVLRDTDAADGSLQLLPRVNNIRDIQFGALPEGFLTKPTLVWLIESRKAGEHLIKVAYQSRGFSWRADYTALIAEDEKSMTLAGWVTITNKSGASYRDAGLKLMAGDVHVIEERERRRSGRELARLESRPKGGPAFEEKAFAEYHLYTLGKTTTLADNQVKQIELFPIAENVPVNKKYLCVSKKYLYRAGDDVGVYLEVKNSKENNLGMPLPAGKVRVYQTDIDQAREFIGDDSIDHTPKDEPVKIRIGRAFDLAAERTRMDHIRPSGRVEIQSWQIKLRNHKDVPVEVEVEEYVQARRNWKITTSTDEFTKKDYRTIVFKKEMPANSEWIINYTVRYWW